MSILCKRCLTEGTEGDFKTTLKIGTRLTTGICKECAAEEEGSYYLEGGPRNEKEITR